MTQPCGLSGGGRSGGTAGTSDGTSGETAGRRLRKALGRPFRRVCSQTDVRVIHHVASVLLSYPSDPHRQLQSLRALVETLPAPPRDRLSRVLDRMAATPPSTLAAEYVETFDLRRRCCPYLTYYTYGDTRKRGYALLRFAHAYRAAGLEPTGEELPDHIAVVLEFSAAGHLRQAGRLLREHRAAVELLARALAEAGSPYADVLEAVRATLPALDPRDVAAMLRLAREGPPKEEVGLE
jgi:nitrate reductase delta subunit